MTMLESTAYNYLFDYIEDVWHMTHEGERLLTICWMILEGMDDADPTIESTHSITPSPHTGVLNEDDDIK